MSDPATPLASSLAPPINGTSPVPQLGVIRAAGDDAASFLQGQLTQDVVLQAVGSTRLAALCNPKGRMLASFQVLKRAPDELLLVTSADTLPASLRRLSMFVLRAKLKLSDATADFALHGLLGEATRQPVQAPAALMPLHPAGELARALWLAPAGTPPPAGAALPPADWLLAEVRSGVARITQPVVEAFVPQMLNYESADGISFKKGCYPGQEVVARSQFRGAIKRRAFVGEVAGPAQAGQEVFAQGDEQPVGLIAQAAPLNDGRSTAVIVSLQLTARDAPALTVGSPDGPALGGLQLPYALREDI
ncbi:MAG: folate-binding protein [Pseudomonadota bacterium]|nr:folate-binding protein [Pseudomonadota bacterium]